MLEIKQLSNDEHQEIAAIDDHAAKIISESHIKNGGYPANLSEPPIDTVVDPWGMYNRESVSYAAFKVYQKTGYMPYWGGHGNANQWPGNARSSGVETGKTPKIGSVAIMMNGMYGHAMWVEEIIDCNMIKVSQYNYNLQGSYSEMIIPSNNIIFIYF